LAVVAKVPVRDGKIAQRGALAAAVADLAVGRQCLLVTLNGAAVVAEVGVCEAQTAQRVGFALAGRENFCRPSGTRFLFLSCTPDLRPGLMNAAPEGA